MTYLDRRIGKRRRPAGGTASRAAPAILCLCSFLLVVLPLRAAGAGPAPGREIAGETTFSGEVVVPKGETWRVLPGATIRFRGGAWTVRGDLLVQGTVDRPVRIAGDDLFEGIDIRGGSGSVLENAVITGGSRGVRVTAGEALFRKVRWERNGVGLDVGQHSRVTIEACAFESPYRVGILVRRGGAAVVVGTRIRGAGKAGIYVSGADDVVVRDALLEANATGLLASLEGARLSVVRTVFRKNGTGLQAEKTAVPSVDACEFVGNGTGLHFTRRAEGRVAGCVIAENGVGVLVEYSSYPVFRENRFRSNRDEAVRLRHQSSEWEEELGDVAREAGGVSGSPPFGGMPGGRGDFRPPGGGATPGGPPGKKAGLTGTVDFRGNDWGELGAEVEKGGNVPGIHDAFDEPAFEFRGKRYRTDRVLLK